MALFEFEDGHLVPAQFGYPVAQDLGPDLVDAICQQVLQIVSRPLFPVTWRDMTGQDDEETPRLTALDVTGQIVSVEILKELDSETLITSLSRLAEVASISWSDLAAEYPSGPEGFRAGWAQFRDSMPPAVGPGPRLIMVAGDIDPSVRPALSVLATSGVEVHLMNLRQMSNGRLFLDVNAVGPRLYGHAPQLLASAAAAPELAAATEHAAPFEESAPAESAIPAPPEEGAEASNEEDSETPTTRPTPKVAPHLREVFTYPIDEEPPAPWKPAAEESSTEDSSDEQPSDEAVEASRDEVEPGEEKPESESEDRADDADEFEGVEAELADELRAADNHAASDEAQDASQDEAQPADEQPVSETAEHAEPAVHGEDVEPENVVEPERADDVEDGDDSEDAEAELADELLDHEDNVAQDAAEAQEHEAADENADDAADESDVDAHDDANASADESRSEEAHEPAAEQQADEQPTPEEEKPRWERPAHMSRRATRRAREESSELNDGGATDAATASSVDRSEESPEVAQARAEGLPVLGRDEAGLRTLAEILGQDTPLVARSELGLPADLVLAASGAISGAGLTYPSLDTLLTARGLGHIDAWGQVRIGDRLGPTLAEALDEINREIVREYAQAPRGQHSAKH
ncbi:hypothetical protein HMPREF1522_0668 [Actinomyces sp. ICM54]|uniref:hypothetical protein n=1 Tax=Actinomyces sp. ICM54 TaxID=936549 RepID=UPI000451BE75|nr:hypothetical protein [Actinomyces sp. ICM54]EWC96773.1 hypothetical protein HMPREF1522_0668 [Actinomyces sp. ICM54]